MKVRSVTLGRIVLWLTFVLSSPAVYAQYVYYQPDGTGIPQTNRLQVIFDNQGESIDSINDASLVPETFYPALTLTFTDIAEGAGFENIFGWYNVGDDITIETNRHPIFYTAYDHGYILPATCDPAAGCTNETCSDPSCSEDPYDGNNSEPFSPPWNTRTLSLCGDPRWKGGPIGFFLVTPEGISGSTARNDVPNYEYIYFSEPRLNILEQGVDNPYIHHLVYQSALDPTAFYFGFEDLYRGGDNDFEDMLVKVEGLLVDAALEECNGIDDDCDGLTDENVTEPCATACGTGVEYCVNGEFDPNTCSARIPTDEQCNGIDDDCNGDVDDGLVQECSNECGSGFEFCVNGEWYGCTAGQSSPEVCDNLDNDCDGQTDEQLNRPCSTDCGDGEEHCDHGGWVGCTAQQPGFEICDNLDNDCDGLTDEDLVLSCGTICGPGTRDCVDGNWTDCSAPVPQPELCDDLDNDCDGQTDEIWVDKGAACTVQQGQCYDYGILICNQSGNGLVCSGQILPQDEVCDGADNDCDGAVDETDPDIGELCGTCEQGQQPPCWTEEGVCEPGRMLCVGGSLACVGEIRPTVEICDLLDNDCDGLTDEDFSDIDEICDDGIDNDCDGQTDLFDSDCSSVCTPGSQDECGLDTGECEPGFKVCSQEGNWSECMGAIGPASEVCDGLDNDCDGETDEDATPEVCDDGIDNDCDGLVDGLDDDCGDCTPGESRPCGSNIGECTPGQQACNAQGHWGPCIGQFPPGPETCDGLDNDCDGITDEGDLCGGYEVCICGSCATTCSAGECPAGDTVCVEGWCLSDRCCGVACPAGFTCDENSGDCVDPCVVSPIDCPADQECRMGECVPFDCFSQGHECPDGQICVMGHCIEDPCNSVQCQDGQYCSQGQCQDIGCVQCSDGQVCENAQCIESSCSGISCAPGQICMEGQCVANPCNGVYCPEGQRCQDGHCGQDPCLEINCPEHSHCDDGYCIGGDENPDGGLDGNAADGQDGYSSQDKDSVSADSDYDAGTDSPSDKKISAHDTLADEAGRLSGGCNCTTGRGSGQGIFFLLLSVLSVFTSRRRFFIIVFLALSGFVVLPGCSSCSNDALGNHDANFFCQSNDDCQEGYRCVSNQCLSGSSCLDFDDDGYCDKNDQGKDCNDNRKDIHPGADELCDGIDNDCDLLTDEDCPCAQGQSQPCGISTGVCMYGLQDCEDGSWGECKGGRMPDQSETCGDMLDNDCDGSVDNGCICSPGDSRPCGSDTGHCTSGVQICKEQDGHWNWSTCTGGTPPRDEMCSNNEDDDCDGAVDEGCDCEPGVDRPCGTNWGTCSTGSQSCNSDGRWSACIGATMPRDEVCDGLDNDCDGLTDDGCECVDGIIMACGTDQGVCQMGTRTCSEGRWGLCSGQVSPSPELCDYLDNDCDGLTDEDFDNIRQPCESGLGTCSRPGLIVCDDNDPTKTKCTATPGEPAVEVCDGLDNDCDGQTDEDFQGMGDQCTVGQGQCLKTGVLVCSPDGLGIVCNATPLEPHPEICDGLDNDCDGHIDENFPLVGAICFAGLGECEVTGTHVCSADGMGVICDAQVPSGSVEECNNLDDDCDGLTDEDLQSACHNQCGDGVITCAAGQWIGCTAPQPFSELCDGIDNDCDDHTDEDFDLLQDESNCGGCGLQCSPPHGTGLCVQGNCVVESCEDGWIDLNTNPIDGCEYPCTPSGPEQCNGIDDDCDGQTDEEPGSANITCLSKGVCTNVQPRCRDGNWTCTYPPTYQQTETLCDNLDNDCDGVVDEGFAQKNQPCSAGLGVCKTGGVIICNQQQDGTICSATSDNTNQGAEVCDGLDNDCDGLVDEDLDYTAEMVHIVDGSMSFWIDRWEASRPDATSDQRGFMTNHACSKPGVMPWDDIDWNEAKAVCEASQKRLCTDEEWSLACGGSSGLSYPYGDNYDASKCNTESGAISSTGSMPDCSSSFTVLDSSGNVSEWADCADDRDCRFVKPFFGGNFDDELELMWTCWFRNNAGPGVHLVGLGFRCCKND